MLLSFAWKKLCTDSSTGTTDAPMYKIPTTPSRQALKALGLRRDPAAGRVRQHQQQHGFALLVHERGPARLTRLQRPPRPALRVVAGVGRRALEVRVVRRRRRRGVWVRSDAGSCGQ